jgi:hypothetical protein
MFGKTMEFDPPTGGLRPGENVVWARKRDTSFWVIWSSGMLGIGGTLCAVFASLFVGMVLTALLLVLIVVGFVFILRAFIIGRGTKYYLTNERLIQARKGKIMQEIPLEKFRGKSISQFLAKEAVGTVNNQSVYVIKVYDPLSGEILMELKDLDEYSTEALQKVGQIAKCRYCSFINPANSLECKNCGAPL